MRQDEKNRYLDEYEEEIVVANRIFLDTRFAMPWLVWGSCSF